MVVVTSPHGFIRLPELSTEKGEFYLYKLDLNFLIQNRKTQKYPVVLNYFVYKSLSNVYKFLDILINLSKFSSETLNPIYASSVEWNESMWVFIFLSTQLSQ